MSLLCAGEITKRAMRSDWAAVTARLGRTHPTTKAKHIWLHAASNGELTSAKAVIERLILQNRHLLITVNTDSALTMAKSWALQNVSVHLAPVDTSSATRRVMTRWNISAHIALESDLWPHRILICPGPVIVLGGRLTANSAKGWQRFQNLARKIVSTIDYLSAQDQGSLERLKSFGLSETASGPVFDLKALYEKPTDQVPTDLLNHFERSKTWLAASTHDGEDEIVIEAQKKALTTRPDLKLILAPRHPKRAKDIVELLTTSGLRFAQRSKGDDVSDTQVYLADTFGEMHFWYTLAGITFVAGSLTDRGGHTPYEPAAFGSTILHGPDTKNFLASYQRLKAQDAAICIQDAGSLTQALADLENADAQTQLGNAAQTALQQETNFDALMHEIETVLDA